MLKNQCIALAIFQSKIQKGILTVLSSRSMVVKWLTFTPLHPEISPRGSKDSVERMLLNFLRHNTKTQLSAKSRMSSVMDGILNFDHYHLAGPQGWQDPKT